MGELLTIMTYDKEIYRLSFTEDIAGRRAQEVVEIFLAHTIGASYLRVDAVKTELWSRWA